MRFHAILNRDGGTLRSLDLDSFGQTLKSVLEAAGHEVDTVAVPGCDVEAALDDALHIDCDVVMVGGGDGTVSAAASRLKDTGKALAILPAGTMNLFARSLGIPLRLEEAIAAFADGVLRDVDVGSANDHVFVHQFSVGLHAKLIRLREKSAFRSRLGKIWASVRAGFAAFFRPPRMTVALDIDGRQSVVKTAGMAITNNLFGEGHLPFADMPDGGVLGVYITHARRRRDFALLALSMLLGRWSSNDKVEVRTARQVRLTLRSPHARFGSAIDGELCDLEPETVLTIHPGALKVLVPRAP